MEAQSLIDAIVADPDDDATWLVYADWLLERGDPRGELIRLAPTAEAGDNAARWRISQIENYEEPLLSPALAAHARQWRLAWHRGFIRHAELMNETREQIDASTLSALCRDPHAALLSSIDIDVFDGWDHPVDEHSGHTRDRQRRLRYEIGDVDRELSHVPRLTSLRLRGVAFVRLAHAGIRHLDLSSHGIVNEFELPTLTGLDVELGTAALVAQSSLFQRPPPTLTSLRLDDLEAGAVPVIARSTVLRQLRALELHEPSFDVVAAIVEHAAAFIGIPDLYFGTVLANFQDPAVIAVREELDATFGAREAVKIHWMNSSAS